jgi:superfamily I DNA/RNA helicase
MSAPGHNLAPMRAYYARRSAQASDFNHRSDVAGVIAFAAEPFTKGLWTDRRLSERPRLVSVRNEADQTRCIVERVLENREVGTSLKQQAILFRTSHHSTTLEIELHTS